MSFILLILGMGLVSLAVSWVCTAVLIRVAPRLGFVDRPGFRKIHQTPKPLGGGIAIFVGLALPILAGLAYAQWGGVTDPGAGAATLTGRAWHALAIHRAGIVHQTPLALGLLVAMLLMHVLGLWDDKVALGPYVKLVIQLSITAGLVVAFRNQGLRALTVMDKLGWGEGPSIVVTVLWIAGITNAFNFMDNMDGLSAGVAGVCAAAFLVTTLWIGQWFVATVLAMFLGSVVGFLWFNFSPAKIFMGDSGSLLLGLVLGVMTIRTTYLPVGQNLAGGWYPLLTPLIVMAVPLYDMVVVSVIRIYHGRSPFVGDTNHLSHRLVARGMSRPAAVLCIWLMTGATSIAAVILPHVGSAGAAVLLYVQTVMVLGLVGMLEWRVGTGEGGMRD